MRFAIKTSPQDTTRVGVLVTGSPYGLGAGWNQEECDAYGIDLPPLKERFDRFDEALEPLAG